MKKEEMILVVDTETAMINPTAKVSGCNSLVYDIGLAVANRKGEIAQILEAYLKSRGEGNPAEKTLGGATLEDISKTPLFLE